MEGTEKPESAATAEGPKIWRVTRNCCVGFANKFRMTALEYVITIVVFSMDIGLSILFEGKDGIQNVIDTVGDYGCGGVSFVFPPIIFLCTFKRSEYSTLQLVAVVSILCFGVFVWIYELADKTKIVNWKFEQYPKVGNATKDCHDLISSTQLWKDFF